jgi:hypothetical protein
LLVGFVIGAIAARSCRIEHHPHVDTGILPVDDRRDQTRFGERELLDQ